MSTSTERTNFGPQHFQVVSAFNIGFGICLADYLPLLERFEAGDNLDLDEKSRLATFQFTYEGIKNVTDHYPRLGYPALPLNLPKYTFLNEFPILPDRKRKFLGEEGIPINTILNNTNVPNFYRDLVYKASKSAGVTGYYPSEEILDSRVLQEAFFVGENPLRRSSSEHSPRWNPNLYNLGIAKRDFILRLVLVVPHSTS